MEELLMFIQTKIDEHDYELSELHAKYEDGDLFSSEDTAMMDYHEGAIESMSVILEKGRELFNA